MRSIKQRTVSILKSKKKRLSKKLSKYIVVFQYADNMFIGLSETFGTLSIVSHATIVGMPFGLAGASLTVAFSVITGIVKKLLNATRKKKKKHNKIVILVKSKLNSIETSMSSSKCVIFGNKKSRFMKEQKAKGLLSNFGIRTPLSKIPLLNVLF